MNPQMQVLVFRIGGRMEKPRQPLWERLSQRRMQKAQPEKEPRPDATVSVSVSEEWDDAAVVKIMNENADEIAAEIEAEIRKVMPSDSDVSPQAEIAFSRGSVVVEGTIVLLGWAGQVAWEAFRAEMAQVIKAAVRRVMGKFLASLTQEHNSFPAMAMSINVTPASARPMPPSPPIAPPAPSGAASPMMVDWTRVVPILLALLFAFILIMDRYFPPPGHGSAAAPASVTPATVAPASPSTR